jgi:hypothetical protein
VKKVHVTGVKARTRALVQFILANVTGHRTSFEVSDVKGDGTVFVRFRSTPHDPATHLAEAFREALVGRGIQFYRTEDTKFRFALVNFSPDTA